MRMKLTILKYLFAATMLLTNISIFAQRSEQSRVSAKKTITIEKPDLNQIKRETLSPQSKFYFPKLKKKYEKKDTVMTNEEFRYFYLGYMFQEDYDPYRESQYDKITAPLKAKTTHTKEEVDTLIKYAELSLEDNPFDLRHMSFLVHALKEKEKSYRAKIWEYRLENLLAAIKSTGTGKDTENAWYVITPVHEYDMVQLLGYNATDVDFDTHPGYDILKVEPDQDSANRSKNRTASEFYFNVVIPTEQFELKHPENLEETEDELLVPTDEAEAEPDPDEAPAE